MKNKPYIPGTFAPVAPRKSYQLRRIISQAASSAEAVYLLLEHALGQQPDRPLTHPVVPRWAATAMEGVHHG